MAHRYVFTQTMSLKGEAVIEGNPDADWFNISPELAKRMVDAPEYWVVYFVDDVTVTGKDSILEAASESSESELATLLKWQGVLLVIVGTKEGGNDE